jgi:hypothetical protein
MPFRLVFRADAVIPVETGAPTWRMLYPANQNNQLLMENLDLADEVRETARLKEKTRKQQVAQWYNLRVSRWSFEVGDLVLRMASISLKNAKDGKLAANCERPYKILQNTRRGGYALETLQGRELPRTFNAANLRQFYS